MRAAEDEIIYLPGVGYTRWEPELHMLICTPHVQRLRSIKQTGAAHHTFPGATHTRFEHSLGVGHVAERFVNGLVKRDECGLDPFVFKLAGLCHDLGHGPLSHAFDAYLKTCTHVRDEMRCHEARSAALLRDAVKTHGIPIAQTDVDIACELIYPQTRALPAFWYHIIANNESQIDVDKLDYVRRDCARTGILRDVDIDRFVEYARVVDGRLCYPTKMAYDVYEVFAIRHQLHSRVFQHQTVKAIEYMLTDVMQLILPSFDLQSPNEFIGYTDLIFTPEWIMTRKYSGTIGDEAAAAAIEILERIEKRELYTLVGTLPKEHTLAPPPCAIIDKVTIGYEENPLYAVDFLSGQQPCKLLTDEYSSFPIAMRDCYTRVFARNERDAAQCRAWMLVSR